MPPGDLTDSLEVALLRQHDPDVGQRGLHQQARDIALAQPPVERLEVVERHHGRRDRHVDLRAERTRPRHDPAAVQHREGLVDGAVVAPVHHRDPRPAGQVPGEAQHEPVGVGRRHRQLPGRHPEATGQLLTDPGRVRRGQHRGDARGGLPQRPPRATWGSAWPVMAPVSPEAEVDVLDAVDVGQPRPGRRREEDREGAGPAGHPGHRHPGQQVPPSPSRPARRSGVRRSTNCCSSAARRSARRWRSIMPAI